MAVKIQLRRGATGDWPANLVLDSGEVGVDTTTKQYKVGDGTTTWSVLPYWGSGTITQITAGTGLKLNTVAGATSTAGVVTLDVDTAIMMARSIVSAKGQVVVGGGASSPVALPVSGTNNFVLVADSTDATYGVKWGNIVEASIAPLAVTTGKLADSAVTTEKIASNAVTTAKITDLNITTGKLADSAVSTTKLADLAVSTAKIADLAVSTAKIADLAVSTAKIADSNVTSAKIADSAVTTAKIAALNVTGAKIANSTISAGKLDTLYCQSGTGSGQSGNVVKIGWSPASNLRVQVDATDFGATWPINITGSSTSVSGQTSGSTANAVVQRDGNANFSANIVNLGNYPTASGSGILRAGVNSTSSTPVTTNNVYGGYHVSFYRDGSNIGSISDNGGGTSFNTTSDYRLKENVVNLVNALETVEKLLPKTYNFIADKDIIQDGFIAHELEEIVPYAVTGIKDAVDAEGAITPQQVDYSKLVTLLVGAVQELSARVKELENK